MQTTQCIHVAHQVVKLFWQCGGRGKRREEGGAEGQGSERGRGEGKEKEKEGET